MDGAVTVEGKEPQKLTDLCNELEQHGVTLCALSEIRWKGEGTYRVNKKWFLVFSGLPEDAEKGEQGVGILMQGDVYKSWKSSGEICNYAGSRLISIRLCIKKRWFSVISCYAPTFTSPEQEKDSFYIKLHEMVKAVPSRDELVILGDFNARVGPNKDREHDPLHCCLLYTSPSPRDS